MGIYSSSQFLDFSWIRTKTVTYSYYERILEAPLFGVKKRSGCVVACHENGAIKQAEIAPLPQRSKETLTEAVEDFRQGRGALPSSRFALDSLRLQKDLPKEAPPTFFLCTGSLETIKQDALKSCSLYMKVKLSRFSIQEAIHTMKTLQRDLPGKIWALDCNRAWSLPQALQFFSAFHPDDFFYVEEPVSSFSILKCLSKRIAFPLAVDESLYDEPLENLLRLEKLRAIIVKPTLYGGYTDLLSLKNRLPEGVLLVLSSCIESKVGLYNLEALHHALKLNTPLGTGTNRFFL